MEEIQEKPRTKFFYKRKLPMEYSCGMCKTCQIRQELEGVVGKSTIRGYPVAVMAAQEIDGLLVFGISRCNTVYDSFNKKYGRELAIQRLNTMKVILERFPKRPRDSFKLGPSGLSGHAPIDRAEALREYFDHIDHYCSA
jgi:hypothetical protein